MTVLRTIKQLNEPQPVEVQALQDGIPQKIRLMAVRGGEPHRSDYRVLRRPQRQQLRSIRSDGQWMKIVSIEDRWKINDEWWRGEELEIERLYFDLVLENNQRMTVFRDLIRDTWARQAE